MFQGGMLQGKGQGFLSKVKSFFPLLDKEVRQETMEHLKEARSTVREKRGKA